MAFVSTFELLLKPQLPKAVTTNRPELAALTRNVIQGYFLSISNITENLVFLSVVFTTRTPGLEKGKVLALLDTLGGNDPTSEEFGGIGEIKKTRFTFPINANDTGLFILQPNALDKALVAASNFELRGYVEIFLSSVSTPKTAQLLITPEHRGTFFGTSALSIPSDKSELGEIAYTLPLADGKSLFELGKDS
jgi:hypothetical protein